MIAIGNIGNKIGNFGSRFGRNATGIIRGSEGFKEAQAQLRGRNAERFLNRDLKRQNWQNKHRFLGAAGRASRRVFGNMYDQKRARAMSEALKVRNSNQAAGFLAGSDFDKKIKSNEEAMYRRHINELSKEFEDAHADVATDEDALSTLHANALSALEREYTDENLAAVEAYQNMLSISDPGRQMVFDNLAGATKRGDTRSIEYGARHMLREHTKDVKPNNRDMFSFLGAASRASSNPSGLHRDSFTTYEDTETGKQHYSSSFFASKGFDSYDPMTFSKIDVGSLDRLIQQGGTFKDDTKSMVEGLILSTVNQPNVHVQDKVRKKYKELLKAMGSRQKIIDMVDSGSFHVPKDKRKQRKNRRK